jgi:uncharacterized protein YecT (DUF1311 family)
MAALVMSFVGAFVAPAHADDTSAASADKHLRPGFDACMDASEGVTVKMNSCLAKEFDYQDKRLNTAYQALRKSMSDKDRLALRDEERAWIKARDTECAPDKDGGTAALLVSSDCALTQTAQRATELEDQLKK